MPSNRSNDKIGRTFDIGTKIEYNDKLYEVVEQKFCDGCSLKCICPNNDAVENNKSDNLLSRGERIKIFGECSSIKRKDHKAVVFKEIPINIAKDKYYKIAPLYREDNPSKLKAVEFDLLNDYVIDFGEGVQCNDYSPRNNHYKRSSKRKGYIIPYSFPLNTRRGFRSIYYLMKLSQHDMTNVIKDIIAVRRAGIDFILNRCDKLEKENDNLLTLLYGEARM